MITSVSNTNKKMSCSSTRRQKPEESRNFCGRGPENVSEAPESWVSQVFVLRDSFPDWRADVSGRKISL